MKIFLIKSVIFYYHDTIMTSSRWQKMWITPCLNKLARILHSWFSFCLIMSSVMWIGPRIPSSWPIIFLEWFPIIIVPHWHGIWILICCFPLHYIVYLCLHLFDPHFTFLHLFNHSHDVMLICLWNAMLVEVKATWSFLVSVLSGVYVVTKIIEEPGIESFLWICMTILL
jgi:hypothetical protein